MLQPTFKTARKLAEKADDYFSYIEGEYYLETVAGKDKKVTDREAEPATIAGLALFLGFNSRQDFEDYEQNGEFGYLIKRSRLRVEALYERKLHQQSPSGAIFALKALGWKEKTDDKTTASNTIKSLKIEIVITGPKPAESEKEVVM
ncbi:DNA-packaging protein gp3 [Mucilaginibacter frigoritolerans]|uniref:DNA-packaging protein gp3 n=1 Tax=Mucilaginibacter frigoritolerans TaxID=652788 RepID=A0A562TKF1_9SPHI|nr:terminase small subunit [Mucilaginibacter frigoritolerans]TWI94029.1 DNA-packaging protein gp3 [Mucilaginibacter frigoritolerans]